LVLILVYDSIVLITVDFNVRPNYF